MTQFRNSLIAMGLVVASILGAPSQSRAGFALALIEDGGSPTTVATGPDFTALGFTGTYGNFTITLLGAASNNGGILSNLLGSNVSIVNNGSGSHTLQIFLIQTNYTLPVGAPLNVASQMGGTVFTGTLGFTGIFQAAASSTNDFTADFTNGPQNGTPSGGSFQTGTVNGLFNRTGGPNSPYALMSLVTLDVSGGGSVNYSNSVTVTAVPAPAGLVLALSGVPIFGLRTLIRRRRTRA